MREARLIVSILLTGIAAAAAAQPDPQERVAVGFVDRVAAGSADELVAYMRRHFTPELWERRPAADWERMAEMIAGRHAGLELLNIRIDRQGQWQLGTRDPGGMDLTFFFEFAAGGERIASFSLEASPAGHGREGDLPPLEVEPGAGREGAHRGLERWFARLDEEGLFSGTALAAWRGKVFYASAHGLASRRWNVPNRLETRFDIGSINKTFTKVAIGQLHLAGELAFDDTIADYLPDYPNPDVERRVTLRHLLDHSSGIGDIFTDRYRRTAKNLLRGPRDFFFLFADEPLLFEPGTSRRYSNGGYMVLGAVIEAITGRSYADYVEEKIFAPAGMERTGFFPRDEPVPDVAVGYTTVGLDGRPGGVLRNNLFRLPVVGNSAGSAQATVEDLLRFDEALREHRLLPPAYTAWVVGGEEPNGGEAEPGEASRSMVGIGYAGGAPGVSAVVESDGDLTVIVLSNADEPSAEAVARALTAPLRRALSP